MCFLFLIAHVYFLVYICVCTCTHVCIICPPSSEFEFSWDCSDMRRRGGIIPVSLWGMDVGSVPEPLVLKRSLGVEICLSGRTVLVLGSAAFSCIATEECSSIRTASVHRGVVSRQLQLSWPWTSSVMGYFLEFESVLKRPLFVSSLCSRILTKEQECQSEIL